MLENLEQIMTKEFAGCEVWRLMVFFGALFAALVIGRLSRYFMERAATRSTDKGQGVTALLLNALAKPAVLLVVAGGMWLGLAALNLQDQYLHIAETVSHVIYAVAIGYAVYRLVDLVDYYLSSVSGKTESKLDDMLAPLVGKSIRITVAVLVILQVVQALSDKPITSILAGLGVGGLAVALAGQDTIKNFFGSIVILADKPFEIGDRIVVDGHDGPVEDVGFRSTKIRTLKGHLVTVPNSGMVDKVVQNIGKRPYIKRVANITVTYDTSPEKVKRGVAILKEILDNHEGMNPDFPPRVYFSDFNDWALNIVMIYWYHPPEYWDYMAFTENVNQQILERFNAEGIEFAFPSQTVYHANDDNRQLAVRMLKEQG